MYSSTAFCSSRDKGYNLPLGTCSPDSRSIAQSHGQCGGSCEAREGQNTSYKCVYSVGMPVCLADLGLSIAVTPTSGEKVIEGL